jgi:hypothetical protein
MTPEQCLMAYAMAFEETYQDDDWTRLAPFFAEDATYEVIGGALTCKIQGRDAIFRGLKKSIDGLDRRCDSRSVELTGSPEVDGDRVEIDWKVHYERGDAPRLSFAGRSIATVTDDHITSLVDRYDDAEVEKIGAWMQQYGQGLDGSYV